jgi:hypothetical protein
MIDANPHYGTDAKKIERDAPEVLDHVQQGKQSIPQAKQVAALPVEQHPAAMERVRRNNNAEEVIDTLVEEVETLQFIQCFATPFDPTGAKTEAEILPFAQRAKPEKTRRNGCAPWHATCSPSKE